MLKFLWPNSLQKKPSSVYELFRNLFPFGMAICLRYAKDDSVAKIILNKAFLRLVSRMKRGKKDADLLNQFKEIIMTTVIEQYKYVLVFESLPEGGNSDDHFEISGTITLSNLELLEMVRSLPLEEMLIFNMHVIDGFSNEKIAHLLGTTINNLEYTLYKARKNLMDRVREHESMNV